MIWPHGLEELEKFVSHLNSCHETIKFTMDASTEKINFLDTTLHVDTEGNLWTDLYCKPTDSHSYLHYQSAHPPHCKRSLPYSQALRLKRICTNSADFVKHLTLLSCHFKKRGYPTSLLIDAFKKVSTKTRLDLLNEEMAKWDEIDAEITDVDQGLFLISTYNPGFDGLKEIVSKNWDLLKRSSTSKILAESKITFGYRRPPNLKDLLVRARVPQPTVPKYKRPHCEYMNRCTNKSANSAPF